MGGLTTPAIIVIVLVGCLGVTALGAALFRQYNPAEVETPYTPQREQFTYMRTVRMRNYAYLKRESEDAAKDLESRFTPDEASGYYHPQHEQQYHQAE
ncbi:hypothetical protein N7474_008217 [Penicillium riverlandense]|uniref:uncharacterized protein n=1 Tax=Penicillium riverlandense TaxID=1903569 RepID=UPI0025498A08|nr:uncharacterized protein N7474_008217 [Penicillium riverlandense]KAJ5811916.1 hypothetical protein N7474_008217 [Penicillium riverlandense]